MRAITPVNTQITYGQPVPPNGGTGGNFQTLDGVLTYSNSLPDLASLDETSVKTYANTAEVSAAGVATVMIVKSGGNDFHGKLRESYQNANFSSTNVDALLESQGVTVGRQMHYFTDNFGELGGPFIRNRLWFYGAFHDIVSATYLPGFVGPGPGGTPALDKSSEPIPTGKVSFQLTPHQKFIAFGAYEDLIENAYAQGNARFIPFESTFDYHQPFPSAKIEWQGTFGSRLFVSLLEGYHKIGAYRDPQPCCASEVSTYIWSPHRYSGSAWSSLRGYRGATRHQTSGTLNYTAPDFLGSHQITGGFSVLPETFFQNLPYSAEGSYLLVYNNGTPSQLWAQNNPVVGTS